MRPGFILAFLALTPAAASAERPDTPGNGLMSYWRNKDRNPALVHGEAAANFGSGGLFGRPVMSGLFFAL